MTHLGTFTATANRPRAPQPNHSMPQAISAGLAIVCFAAATLLFAIGWSL